MLNGLGRAGILLPTGIATDDTTKLFFSDLIERQNLYQILGLENESFIFPAVHHSFKFCAFTITGSKGRVEQADFAFLCREYKDADQIERHFRLRREDLLLINPNTRTCPIFRTRADAELTRKIYERVPVLLNKQTGDNPWAVRFLRMIDMANDSGLFRTREQLVESGLTCKYNQFVKPDDEQDIWLPLYEAKMIWHFDHRYGTYEGATQAQLNVGTLPRPSVEQKSDPEFVMQPRYWVEAREVYLRSAMLPTALLQAVRYRNAELITLSLAHLLFGNWLLQKQHYGTSEIFRAWCSFIEEYPFARQLAPTQIGVCGNNPACFSPLDDSYVPAVPVDEIKRNSRESTAWHTTDPRAVEELLKFAAAFPISSLYDESKPNANDAMKFAEQLLEQTAPKWFLGFRDVTNTTNERTVICSLLPRAAVGHTMPLMFFRQASQIRFVAAFIVNTNTLVFDYIARQKVGGTHLTFSVLNQLPVLAPSTYTVADVDFILPRALELLYTGVDLEPFAEDCGYSGRPFRWDEETRALIRAELDAYYAKLYGLTRDELRYILDPKEVYGEDFPSETFRVLKEKEIRQFGEYRTRRLVLEAWDKLFAV